MASTTTPATSRPDLLRRVAMGWSGLWPMAAAIGDARMREATPAGWTYGALLAHVAAWERATAERLARYAASGERAGPPGQADEFNARVASSAAGRAPASIRRELLDAHEALVAAVSALDDAQVAAHVEETPFGPQSWVFAVVAGDSFGHYAEHEAELAAGVPRTGDELARRVAEGWGALRQAVGFVGERRLARRTPVGWTGKAVVAHTAHWMEWAAAELPARLSGGRGAPPDVDGENARVAKDADAAPVRDALVRLERAYETLRAAVEAIPENAAITLAVVRLCSVVLWAQLVDHAAELDHLRPRTATELASRVDEAWRPVRQRIRDIGRSRMGERIANGWTYKDLVGHLAAWEEHGERGIRDWRAGTFAGMDGGAVDAFNAREVGARRLVGPEAILDELDTAHRRLADAARALTPDELAHAQVLGFVEWNTYLHYRDHAADLGLDA